MKQRPGDYQEVNVVGAEYSKSIRSAGSDTEHKTLYLLIIVL